MADYESKCPFKIVSDVTAPSACKDACPYNGNLEQCLREGKVEGVESRLIAYIVGEQAKLDKLGPFILNIAIQRAKEKEPGEYRGLLSYADKKVEVRKFEQISDEEFRKRVIDYVKQKKKTNIGDIHTNLGTWYDRDAMQCSELLHKLEEEGLIKGSETGPA